MNLDELAVEYYHSSLDLAQKALVSGLTVAGVAYLVAITGERKSPYSIPIIGVEVASFSCFSIALLILFVACGALCCYGVNKAMDNWSLVSDQELSFRLLQAPNIFMAGAFIYSLLYGFFFMVGVNLSEIIFGVDGWGMFVFGSATAFPYYVAFSRSSKLKELKKTQSK